MNRRVEVWQGRSGMVRFGEARKRRDLVWYGEAGVVGCVQSIHGQARRVLVRLAPVSWGRYGAVRCGKLR